MSIRTVIELNEFLCVYGLYNIKYEFYRTGRVKIYVNHFWFNKKKLERILEEEMSIGTKVIVDKISFKEWLIRKIFKRHLIGDETFGTITVMRLPEENEATKKVRDIKSERWEKRWNKDGNI